MSILSVAQCCTEIEHKSTWDFSKENGRQIFFATEFLFSKYVWLCIANVYISILGCAHEWESSTLQTYTYFWNTQVLLLEFWHIINHLVSFPMLKFVSFKICASIQKQSMYVCFGEDDQPWTFHLCEWTCLVNNRRADVGIADIFSSLFYIPLLSSIILDFRIILWQIIFDEYQKCNVTGTRKEF